MVWNLARLNRQTKVAKAMELRQVAKLLGMPPVGKDDENLAGGNITIGANPAWIIGAMLLGAAAFWFVTRQPDKASAAQPEVQKPTTVVVQPSNPGIDLQVIPPNPPLEK